MTIEWQPLSPDLQNVMYYIDHSPVGEGDQGFEKILGTIRAQSPVQVTIKIHYGASKGGSSLADSFPFGKRFNELKEAMGQSKLAYEFD